jgi:acetylglutamate kinase
LPGTGEAKRYRAQLIFDDYNNALRWNDFDQASSFVDPAISQANPLTDLERKRYDMVQVTGVTVRSSVTAADGSVDRVVEIQLVGKLTQVERKIIDHQHWRWDQKAKRFWLVSGLPDITATD